MTWLMPDIACRTKARSLIEPTISVKAEGLISMPRTQRLSALRVRISASPRWPALPVTSIVITSSPNRSAADAIKTKVSRQRINYAWECRKAAGSADGRDETAGAAIGKHDPFPGHAAGGDRQQSI